MAAVRHLGFVGRLLGPPTTTSWWSLSFAKFGWNRCSSFDYMKLSIFCPFGLKTPIHAPKIGVFGGFHPRALLPDHGFRQKCRTRGWLSASSTQLFTLMTHQNSQMIWNALRWSPFCSSSKLTQFRTPLGGKWTGGPLSGPLVHKANPGRRVQLT